ncbi:hypothetical protein ACWGOQ_0018975 [Aquimarina sp. M1]
MKTTLKFLSYYVIVLTMVLTTATSCDGEDGMDGAEGPQGIAGQDGADGQDGEDGQDGQDGEDGNAEVIYSDWIPADFTGTSTSVKFMDIDFPAELPSATSIKNTHIILVYFTGFGDGNVYLLPVLNFRGAQFTYGFGSGSSAVEDILIRAQALSGDLNEFQIDPARGNRFRYVIIPPNVSIGRTSIDYNDYEAVKRAYNLKN